MTIHVYALYLPLTYFLFSIHSNNDGCCYIKSFYYTLHVSFIWNIMFIHSESGIMMYSSHAGFAWFTVENTEPFVECVAILALLLSHRFYLAVVDGAWCLCRSGSLLVVFRVCVAAGLFYARIAANGLCYGAELLLNLFLVIIGCVVSF